MRDGDAKKGKGRGLAMAEARSRRLRNGGTELGSGLGGRRWQRRAVTFSRGHRVIFRKQRMY